VISGSGRINRFEGDVLWKAWLFMAGVLMVTALVYTGVRDVPVREIDHT
jgi:hypothetical protein